MEEPSPIYQWKTRGKHAGTEIIGTYFEEFSQIQPILYKHEDSLIIRVDISGIKTYASGVILFEFGISTGSIERRNLLGPRDSASMDGL